MGAGVWRLVGLQQMVIAIVFIFVECSSLARLLSVRARGLCLFGIVFTLFLLTCSPPPTHPREPVVPLRDDSLPTTHYPSPSPLILAPFCPGCVVARLNNGLGDEACNMPLAPSTDCLTPPGDDGVAPLEYGDVGVAPLEYGEYGLCARLLTGNVSPSSNSADELPPDSS
jgi:hypothetical protein